MFQNPINFGILRATRTLIHLKGFYMKKTYLAVFTVFLSLAVSSSLAADTLGDNHHATQSFHQASDVGSAGVRVVHEKAESRPVVTATKKADTGSIDATTASELQDRLAQVGQAGLLYQQETNQRIEGVSDNIAKMQAQLNQLTQALALINQEVARVSGQASAVLPGLSSGSTTTQEINRFVFWSQEYALYIIAVLLLTIVYLMATRRSTGARSERSAASVAPTASGAASISLDEDDDSDDDIKDEYDFMGSTEAIPAKLDLAHAYIAMEDFKAARKVLRQVIASGNVAQQQEAKGILDKIAAKK